MILLLGSSGYMGQAFATELRRRGDSFIPLTRKAISYADFNLLFDFVRKLRPEFIINAAGYPGNPNVDAWNWPAMKPCLPTPCCPRPLPGFPR